MERPPEGPTARASSRPLGALHTSCPASARLSAGCDVPQDAERGQGGYGVASLPHYGPRFGPQFGRRNVTIGALEGPPTRPPCCGEVVHDLLSFSPTGLPRRLIRCVDARGAGLGRSEQRSP